MKALVLAGVPGSTLRPIISTFTQHRAPTATEPILCHGLNALRDRGNIDAGMVAGDAAPMIEAVGDGSGFVLSVPARRFLRGLGADCAVVPGQPQRLGAAEAGRCRRLVKG
ncbi:MAG: hypothetical protein J2P26_04675 [Nocardiopsaceae bacterium]|nr:hypothetical protein [Nocardiopsaceae bacterium]